MTGNRKRLARRRPRPTSRLERQVRDYWEASRTLGRSDAWLETKDGEAAARMAEAIRVLSLLITGHTRQRLRQAAGDRLMSVAPDAAALVFERQHQIDS